jgi:hypothetical protein
MVPVDVTVYLDGTAPLLWRCFADHPSIRLVMEAVAANANPTFYATSPLVRLLLPDDGAGERGVVVLRSKILAVETRPPLPDLMPTIHDARQAWLRRLGEQVPASQKKVERPTLVVVRDFLAPEERDVMWEHVTGNEGAFVPAGVRSIGEEAARDDHDYRRARLRVGGLEDLRAAFVERLEAAFPQVLEALGVERPTSVEWEVQVTHHGDLDWFKVHTDNASDELRSRKVTWIYYLSRTPRPWTGGELVLFDLVTEGEQTRRGDGFQTLLPEDNSLVAFLPQFYHQVRSVSVPGGAFLDGRFTVNGWLHDRSARASQ